MNIELTEEECSLLRDSVCSNMSAHLDAAADCLKGHDPMFRNEDAQHYLMELGIEIALVLRLGGNVKEIKHIVDCSTGMKEWGESL